MAIKNLSSAEYEGKSSNPMTKVARADADEFIKAHDESVAAVAAGKKGATLINSAVLDTDGMNDEQRRTFASTYRTALRVTHPRVLVVTKQADELVALTIRPAVQQQIPGTDEAATA